ncbi:MAG: tRNA lysidine(34) synthetase TilS [Flavobacteriales bacterium]
MKYPKIFTQKDAILVAVSGGIDSVVLLHLLKQEKLNIAAAHCNFSLRCKDSDGDEAFVKHLAKSYQIPFFTKKFNTKKFAKDHSLSTQMAARELRYAWFKELAKVHSFTKIAVAHHADDQFETVLLNLVRGTGISGLTAMHQENGNIVRPLLSSTRKEIEAYAKKNKLKWREDASNAEDKYARNKIRHNVISALHELNTSLLSTFSNSRARLRNVQVVFEKAKSDFLVKAAFDGGWKFKVGKDKVALALLSEILFDFGFTHDTISKVGKSNPTESGKIFLGKNCRLLKNRNEWILTPLQEIEEEYFVKKGQAIAHPLALKTSSRTMKGYNISKERNLAQLDEEKLKFPLKLRKWKQGDWFIPFGMKGKMKLSDFFINQKFSLLDKENVWILESGNDIVWIVGHRVDQRYAVGEKTKKVYLAQVK